MSAQDDTDAAREIMILALDKVSDEDMREGIEADVDAMLAALAAAGIHLMRWRPISEARRDGWPYLGYMGEKWMEGIYWADDDWRYLSDGDSTPHGRNKPTYFAHLPPLPEEPSR